MATREAIKVVITDPNSPDKPVLTFTTDVPKRVVEELVENPDNVQKYVELEMRIAIVARFKAGKKKKQKSGEVEITDNDLLENIKKYVDNFDVGFHFVRTEETPLTTIKVGTLAGKPGQP